MKNTIIGGILHLVDKSNRKVNLQASIIEEVDSTTFTNGDNLPNDGNIHVNSDGGGWLSILPVGPGSKWVNIYLAQGTHPIAVKAVRATTGSGTPALAATDILILI